MFVSLVASAGPVVGFGHYVQVPARPQGTTTPTPELPANCTDNSEKLGQKFMHQAIAGDQAGTIYNSKSSLDAARLSMAMQGQHGIVQTAPPYAQMVGPDRLSTNQELSTYGAQFVRELAPAEKAKLREIANRHADKLPPEAAFQNARTLPERNAVFQQANQWLGAVVADIRQDPQLAANPRIRSEILDAAVETPELQPPPAQPKGGPRFAGSGNESHRPWIVNQNGAIDDYQVFRSTAYPYILEYIDEQKGQLFHKSDTPPERFKDIKDEGLKLGLRMYKRDLDQAMVSNKSWFVKSSVLAAATGAIGCVPLLHLAWLGTAAGGAGMALSGFGWGSTALTKHYFDKAFPDVPKLNNPIEEFRKVREHLIHGSARGDSVDHHDDKKKN
jgi:hypothetical protein